MFEARRDVENVCAEKWMLNCSINVLEISDVPGEGAANRRQMTFVKKETEKMNPDIIKGLKYLGGQIVHHLSYLRTDRAAAILVNRLNTVMDNCINVCVEDDTATTTLGFSPKALNLTKL